MESLGGRFVGGSLCCRATRFVRAFAFNISSVQLAFERGRGRSQAVRIGQKEIRIILGRWMGS